jgi:hypothetical protein
MNSDFFDFDMYSQNIGFFYKNKDKISSKFGIILTIIYIIISLGLFIFYTTKTIKRTSINVHDSTIHLKESSKFNIDPNLFYFAFGVENPETSTRFIDETIYYPKVTFYEKIKQGPTLTTVEERELEIERCKQEKFGEKYQSLIVEGELNNSYCINDINLTLSRGFKLNRVSYIKIGIYACVNTTENNNHCKPKEVIDKHISGTFFSLLAKDIGLDPSNYSDPIIPTLQDLHTTIDKSFFRDFVLYFGITEVQTDVGLLLEKINKENYINFIKSTQAFYYRDEEHYYNGETMCEIQFKIGDDIRIQKRSFMKMSEVFAITGGYMQLISTIFKIISLWSNKLSYEEKIINSLFNIYPEKKKITLKNKMQNKLNDFSDKNNYFSFYGNKKFNDISNQNNSEISVIDKNNINKINISDYLIQSKNIDINSNDPTKECIKINKHHKNLNKNLVEEKSKDLINLNENKSKADLLNIGSNCNSINIINRLQKQNNKNTIASEVNKDNKSKKININLFHYCFPKCKNSTDDIKLFNLSLSFYKKEMDITHLFYIILLIEKISKNNNLIINN